MSQMVSQLPRQAKQALTVRDLIEELEALNPDAKVVFACDYGDHCHTQQALPVTNVRVIEDDEYLSESAYSQSGMALRERDEDDDEDTEDEGEGNEPVIILQ